VINCRNIWRGFIVLKLKHLYCNLKSDKKSKQVKLKVKQPLYTLVDFQLDAQIFIYLHILYIFRALTWSSSGGLRRNCIYAASGSFLTGAQDSHLQTVTIPEAAYIQLRRGPPEDEQGNARNM
jgi:hypothetical protein